MKPVSAAESMVLRTLAAAIGRVRSGQLVVLKYHRVLERVDPLLIDEPDADAFEAQMQTVRRLFRVMDLSEAVRRMAAGTLPSRAAAITFDDGYSNNAKIAAPILARLGMSATFYITTGCLDGGRMWNDTVIEAVRVSPDVLDLRDLGLGLVSLPDWPTRRAAVDTLLSALKYREPAERLRSASAIAERSGGRLRESLMMSRQQVRELVRMGMSVGAHTVTHPVLRQIDAQAARREIEEGKRELETILGSRVATFAYPNGQPGVDYEREHVDMVRSAGFDVAVSTAWGAARADDDSLQIPRIAPWDRTARRFGARMIATYMQQTAARV
jgi:peptidoglycan/xylan/chitin deacetylase (PgdA/CDA1 family)